MQWKFHKYMHLICGSLIFTAIKRAKYSQTLIESEKKCVWQKPLPIFYNLLWGWTETHMNLMTFQPLLTTFLGIFGVYGESGRITFDNTAGGADPDGVTLLAEWTLPDGGGAIADPYFCRTSSRSVCVSEYLSFASLAVSQPYCKNTNISSNLWWI